MSNHNEPYLASGRVGVWLLGIVMLLMIVFVVNTLPYMACLQSGSTTEECRNVR